LAWQKALAALLSWKLPVEASVWWLELAARWAWLKLLG
jgi:hypothetical protein